MTWNWQKEDWPNFTYDKSKIESLEKEFLHQAGVFSGVFSYLDKKDADDFKIELLSDEAYKTSEIEGEILDRESLQSSIRKNFGLGSISTKKARLNENGIAELTTKLYKKFSDKLSHDELHEWNALILYGKSKFKAEYRTDPEPMQIISGPVHKPKVHFEAVETKLVKKEMRCFIDWFNQKHLKDSGSLSPLVEAGIAHLYFVSIHPYDDGNGRIARALAQKSLSMSLGYPCLLGLSLTIEKYRKNYYKALDQSNQDLEITDWLLYFARTILEAQTHSQKLVEFIVKKTKFYQNYFSDLNERQKKVIERIFEEGLDGFKGGLSAENYIRIAKTSRATATRDLHELIELGALYKIGRLKTTRYFLVL